MKKLITIIALILITNSINAKEICYYSNYISYKQLVDSTWKDWTNWEEYYSKIIINDSIITIDDKSYQIQSSERIIDDYSVTTKFKILNPNCEFIRLRYQNDGVRQLYIDCKRIVYVYNLI